MSQLQAGTGEGRREDTLARLGPGDSPAREGGRGGGNEGEGCSVSVTDWHCELGQAETDRVCGKSAVGSRVTKEIVFPILAWALCDMGTLALDLFFGISFLFLSFLIVGEAEEAPHLIRVLFWDRFISSDERSKGIVR